MLNLDWFQPYEDSVYSVGVLYLSFLNLPPDEGNKEEKIAVEVSFLALRSLCKMSIPLWALLLMNY